MSLFSEIDIKLEEFSIKIGAKLKKDRPSYPLELRTFEERRIDWVDNRILKAIIIQPTFELNGVNSEKWNFINVAWYDDLGTFKRIKWNFKLVDRKDFAVINSNIDDLLLKSEFNLTKIEISDLK
tara:strand:- start:43 stop:417 length:375 start_codon:yes stop_codon:yes gene_type:complete